MAWSGSAGQGGVPAQIDLDFRGEPTQVIAVGVRHEKRRLAQVHLPGDLLHPSGVSLVGKKTHDRRVAAEGRVRKGVDLMDVDDV